MSGLYQPAHDTGLDAAAEMPPLVGRGSGMTLKEILRRMKAAEARRGIGSQRWRIKARVVAPGAAEKCRLRYDGPAADAVRSRQSAVHSWKSEAASPVSTVIGVDRTAPVPDWLEKLKRIVGGISRDADKN